MSDNFLSAMSFDELMDCMVACHNSGDHYWASRCVKEMKKRYPKECNDFIRKCDEEEPWY